MTDDNWLRSAQKGGVTLAVHHRELWQNAVQLERRDLSVGEGVNRQEAGLFFLLLMRRYEKAFTIITSNKSSGENNIVIDTNGTAPVKCLAHQQKSPRYCGGFFG